MPYLSGVAPLHLLWSLCSASVLAEDTVSTKVLRQEHGEGETMKLRPEGKARG